MRESEGSLSDDISHGYEVPTNQQIPQSPRNHSHRTGTGLLRSTCLMCLIGTVMTLVFRNLWNLYDELTWTNDKGYYVILKNNTDESASIDVHQQPPSSTTNMDTYFSYPDIFPNRTQDLIDFAIVGFAKCGTSFLLRGILGPSPHIHMGFKDEYGIYDEMHQMAYGNLSGFLSYFPSHKEDKVPSVKYGFKEPDVFIWEPSLYHMSTYFPKAKLIVTLRHPIPWFESFYNYRMRTVERYWSDFNITPHNRIGECSREMPYPLSNWSVCTSNLPCVTYQLGFGCTDWSNFHVHLSKLGWTRRNSTRELTLLNHRLVIHTFNFSQSQMFLMEINQLEYRENVNRTNALIDDLESFLELEAGSLPNAERISHDSVTTNHIDKTDLHEEHILKRFISICDDEYRDLRMVLLKQAQDASDWIQEFFLLSPHVFVSDRDYFVHLLKQWHMDPCDTIPSKS